MVMVAKVGWFDLMDSSPMVLSLHVSMNWITTVMAMVIMAAPHM